MQSTKEPKTIKVGGERKFKFITDFSSFDVDCYNEAIEAINEKENFVIKMQGDSDQFSLYSRLEDLSYFWKVFRSIKNQKRKG